MFPTDLPHVATYLYYLDHEFGWIPDTWDSTTNSWRYTTKKKKHKRRATPRNSNAELIPPLKETIKRIRVKKQTSVLTSPCDTPVGE